LPAGLDDLPHGPERRGKAVEPKASSSARFTTDVTNALKRLAAKTAENAKICARIGKW